MDAVDVAQAREDELRAEALANRRPVQETPRVMDGVRVCLGCEDPINKKRLEANPDAVRCAECQQEHERQQMRARGGSIL